MQFLKKNYEKILLGIVLAGLVVAVAFLPFLVANEKQNVQDNQNRLINRSVRALDPPQELMSMADNTLKRATIPTVLDFSATNKLFNPIRWVKNQNNVPIPMPVGSEIDQLQITKISPLNMTVALNQVETTEDNGVRYGVTITHEGIGGGRKGPYFISLTDRKKEYQLPGGRKESIIFVSTEGPATNPNLTIELGEAAERIVISTNAPFRRVEDHIVDLKYVPENKPMLRKREGATISFAGEDYKIVAIHDNDVVLSGPNGKKYQINVRP